MEEADHRYKVDILSYGKTQRIPAPLKKKLKAEGMADEKGKLKLRGVSAKMVKRMKQEYVECPVLNEDIHFIQCFICPNFQSRVTGKVYCKGNPLNNNQ